MSHPLVKLPADVPEEIPVTRSLPPTLRIDCAECRLEGTDACGDCIVTFICAREPGDAVVVDVDELRALRTLGESGLVPRLRHERRSG